MSASLHPLVISELLSAVLACLADDRAALRAACRVDRLWWEAAADVLWRHVRGLDLASVPPVRRQFYADRIRSIDFDAEDSVHHADFVCLTFPRLRRANLDTWSVDGFGRLPVAQYLGPSLEDFRWFGGHTDDDLLGLLAARCPRLRVLLLDTIHRVYGDALGPARFLDFLRRLPSVACMAFVVNMDDLVSDDAVLAHLFARPNLEALELGALLRPAAVERAIRAAAPPFPRLRLLDLRVWSEAVAPLARACAPLTGLADLSLDIADARCPVLPHVARLERLRSLKLTYDCDVEVRREDLLALRPALEVFEVAALDHVLTAPDFADADLDLLARRLPLLRRLVFTVEGGPLTYDGLRSLSRHCGQLQDLELGGIYDLSRLEEERDIAFPHLTQLGLGGLSSPPPPSRLQSYSFDPLVQIIARLVLRHAPKLDRCCFANDDVFTRIVQKRIRILQAAAASSSSTSG